MKAKNKKQLLLIVSFFVILIFISALANLKQKQEIFGGFERVRLEAVPSMVFLVKDCTALSIVVSLEQSYSILNGLAGRMDIRPSTHNLVKSILEEAGIEVLGVKITDLRNNTYYAELVLKKGNQVFSIDSRPSDAIAIGVRSGVVIYVKKELFLKYGKDICLSEGESERTAVEF